MGVRWVSDGCQMGHTGDSALHPELLHLELDDFDVGLPYMDIIHRQLAIDGRHVALSCLRRKYHDFWTSAHKGVRWASAGCQMGVRWASIMAWTSAHKGYFVPSQSSGRAHIWQYDHGRDHIYGNPSTHGISRRQGALHVGVRCVSDGCQMGAVWVSDECRMTCKVQSRSLQVLLLSRMCALVCCHHALVATFNVRWVSDRCPIGVR